jgi:hypothetical protein
MLSYAGFEAGTGGSVSVWGQPDWLRNILHPMSLIVVGQPHSRCSTWHGQARTFHMDGRPSLVAQHCVVVWNCVVVLV